MKKSIIFWGIDLLLLVGFFWIYFPVLSHYRDLKLEEEHTSKELEELDTKIEGLREQRELLEKDVEFLEKTIREELGLVKPGEVVYKFVPEEVKKQEPPEPEPSSSPSPDSKSKPAYPR